MSEAGKDLCGEQACPALGCAAAPKPGAEPYQVHRVLLDWGRFAPQRRASPLATETRPTTTSPLATQKLGLLPDSAKSVYLEQLALLQEFPGYVFDGFTAHFNTGIERSDGGVIQRGRQRAEQLTNLRVGL